MTTSSPLTASSLMGEKPYLGPTSSIAGGACVCGGGGVVFFFVFFLI